MNTDDRYNYRSYDSLMNAPIRLAVMSLLAGMEEAGPPISGKDGRDGREPEPASRSWKRKG